MEDAAHLEALELDYLRDVAELRQQLAAVDTADPRSLARWFAAHPYLTTNDHARAAGVCPRTVRRWQAAAGLPRLREQRPPRPSTATRSALVAPPDWRQGTWLKDSYAAGYGIRSIARAAGRSYTAVRRHLLRRDVVLRDCRDAARSRHPCCCRPWLVRHYAVGGLSLTRCAKLAGVSRSTLASWLVHHGIRVLSASEALVRRAGLM
jgi:transposase-like protein